MIINTYKVNKQQLINIELRDEQQFTTNMSITTKQQVTTYK